MLKIIFNLFGLCNNAEEGEKKPEPVVLIHGADLDGTRLCVGQCNCIS